MLREQTEKKKVTRLLQLWVRKTHKRVKRRYLEAFVAPKVDQARRRRFWLRWVLFMKKAEYLNRQHQQIEQYICQSQLTESFKALKANRERCLAKKKRYGFARQMFIYLLGKRVMRLLQANATRQQQKKQYLAVLNYDTQCKLATKVLKALAEYVQHRKERRVSQVIMIKQC